jgi:hypothetical protein
MIEIMLMYPLQYDLDALVQQDNAETVTEKDFFANYRIFRVVSTNSTCYRHAEIPRHECGASSMQDILIAHIDEPVGGENELLMQYQVSAKHVRMPSIATGISLGNSASELDVMSQILRTLT